MNYIFPIAWLLGLNILIDKMTMGFQGRHQDKRHISYKAKDDGFQADTLADKITCYQIYMQKVYDHFDIEHYQHYIEE